MPKSALLDLQGDRYRSPGSSYESDSLVYGISTDTYGSGVGLSTDLYHVDHQGWVGVTTYVDCEGVFRVKKEVLVACLVSPPVLMELIILRLSD